MKAQPASTRERPRGARRARTSATWKRDPEGRKERILAAASKLFGARGYGNVTTAMVADAAGVSEGIIFHYYRSKPALLREVATRYGRAFSDAMFGADAPAGAMPAPETVIRRAFGYVRFSDPLFGAFLLADGPGDAASAKQANRDEVVERLRALFGAWKARGEIAASDPQMLAELCFGLVEAGLRECYARGLPPADVEERYIAEVARCVRAMLGLERSSQSTL